MDSFAAIKNPLVKTSSLKIKKPFHQIKVIDNGVYGKKIAFDFPKDIDKLSMTFLEYEITTAETVADGIIGYDRLSHNLMESTLFEGKKSRTELMNILPCYARVKYKDHFGTAIYAAIENSIMPEPSFYTAPTSTTTTKIYYPVPLFYSENRDAFLSIRHLEDLRLVLRVNDIDDVGLKDAVSKDNIVITSIKVRMFQESFNKELTNKNMFLNNQDIAVQRKLNNTYNVWYETIDIASGSTSNTTLLRCPYPCMRICAMIYNNESEYEISNMLIKVKNTEILDANRKINYSLYDKNATYSQNTSYSYWFNQDNQTLSNTGLLTFSPEDSMYPTYLTVNYTSPSADAKLYIMCPYITNHSVSSAGVIGASATDSSILLNNSDLVA